MHHDTTGFHINELSIIHYYLYTMQHLIPNYRYIKYMYIINVAGMYRIQIHIKSHDSFMCSFTVCKAPYLQLLLELIFAT